MVEPLANGGAALVALANLNPYSPLPHAGQHHLRVENRRQQSRRHCIPLKPARRRDAEVEAGQSRQRQYRRIQLRVLGELLHPGRNIAPNVRDFEAGITRQQLRFPTRAAGRDHRAYRQVFHGQSRLEPAPRRMPGRPFGGSLPGPPA